MMEVDEEVGGVKAVSVHVSGTVQGVYYRASAQLEGQRLGVAGWVRNLSDGSVALRVQGDPAAVDAMLTWCREGPPAARVSRLEVSDAEPDEAMRRFEVR
jgi:acylphosphatase